MMLSEALNSDTVLNELEEVAERSLLLPQVTAVLAYPSEPPAQTTSTRSTSTRSTSTSTSNKRPLHAHVHVLAPVLQHTQQEREAPLAKRVCNSRPFHRIPCKARGLSNKHNSDTAFYDIPVDAPHGLLLSCSHRECAESGRRFRYCKVCTLPVAKRNFPKRHGHGLVHSAKDLKEVDYMCGFIDSVDEQDGGSCQEPCDEDSTAPFAADSAVVSGSSMIRPFHRRVVSFDANKRAAAAAQQAALGRTIPSGPRAVKSFLDLNPSEKEWLQLLHQRPDLEEDAMMSSWMDKIISFSEEKALSSRGPAAMNSMHQSHFAPMSQPMQQQPQQPRDSIVTPPLPEPMLNNSIYHMEQTTSSPTIMPAHSVSPSSSFEGQLNGFASDALNLTQQAGVKQIMQNIRRDEVSEFVSGLDNVDMTNFFD